MAPKLKNILAQIYADFLTKLAPLYRLTHNIFRNVQRESLPKRIVLLVSRPQDIELLVGLSEKARGNKDLDVIYWVVKNCASRYPKVFTELEEKRATVGMVVSIGRLGRVLDELMRTDAFLSTVESTTAKHKLPYIITRIANAAGLSTYTMQHGFENVGLTYFDEAHGTNVTFAAKTVLTWGQTEKLPAWVSKETRDKAVAVGCPKQLIAAVNISEFKTGERPIVGVFENLHWHRYDVNYVATFLSHLEESARQNPELRFILKSHPDSVRNRSTEQKNRLRRMENVDVADILSEKKPPLTTPWLLSHSLGVITTPSTIALDSALAGVPVAVTRYGLDLGYYSPLSLLDNLEEWQRFLDRLTAKTANNQLKQNGEHFLAQVLVPGDAVTRILNLINGHKSTNGGGKRRSEFFTDVID